MDRTKTCADPLARRSRRVINITSSGAGTEYVYFTSMDDENVVLNTSRLITKLVEIGRAARRDSPVVRLVIEAENYALELQREMVSLLQENERLRLYSSKPN